MSRKILILAAFAIAASLTACGNADSSQDDVVVQQETSITTTAVSTTETSRTQPVTTTTPEETTTEPEETVTTEVTTTVSATETNKESVTEAQAVRYSQNVKVTTKKATPAEKIPATTEYKNYTAPDTDLSTNNGSFPTVDSIIKKAASLLGTPYMWGNKGYTGIYNEKAPNLPLTVAQINQAGIDCSGLVFYTLTQLGYKSDGFMFCNPMPVDTVHWLSVNNGSVISFGGVSSKVDVEKNGLSTSSYKYWERADGSTITPGSVVVGENLYDDNHAWIYMGEFENRDAVIAYLKAIGVPNSLINSKTVGNGKGSGGTHWRIESNGSSGVVINNNTEKENSEPTTYNIYAFRITEKNSDYEISICNGDDKLAGTSLVDKTSVTYGIYRDKSCTSKIGEITIGSGGTGKLNLPAADAYYAKQLSNATGYVADTTVHTLSAGKNKITLNYLTRSIKVKMTSEDGVVSGGEFSISWTRNGKTYSQTAKTDKNGVAEFTGLIVYDMSDGKAINYTVSMINTDTDKYIQPEDQSATLAKGNAELSVSRKLVPSQDNSGDTDNGDGGDVDDSEAGDDTSSAE